MVVPTFMRRTLFRQGRVASRADFETGGQAGFTLLELLVVLGIIALLATVAAPQVLQYLGKARTETAKAQVSAISTALELYSLDNGGFPPQQIGLSGLVTQPQNAPAWKGPYLKRAEGIIDPWGRPYAYRMPGRNQQPEVFTLGRDNAPGGTGEDQDITN
jgi:general secretion pathway protein G